MREMVGVHGRRMSPHVVELVTKPWTAEAFTTANVRRKSLVNAMWRFMRGYDLLLTPTLAVPPFPVHMQGPERIEGRMVSNAAWLSFTFPMNMTGQPAISVPAGMSVNNLPIGLQITGRHLGDAAVLRAAAAFERARPWSGRVPAVVAALHAV